MGMVKKKHYKETRREPFLRIMLTEQERKTLDSFATAKGLPVSTWARMILLEQVKQAPSAQ